MSLFNKTRAPQDNGSDVEMMIKERFRQAPFFIEMFEELKTEPWITQTTSYYDTRKREVKIYDNRVTFSRLRDDLELVHMYPKGIPTNDNLYPAHYDGVWISFISHGYRPLHPHGNISIKKIRELFASVLIEKLMEKVPEISFSGIVDEPLLSKGGDTLGRVTMFTYTVPDITYNDWF